MSSIWRIDSRHTTDDGVKLQLSKSLNDNGKKGQL